MKFLYRLFIASILISLMLTAVACAGDKDSEFIQVLGTASREVEPDTAFISMAVETKAETANGAKVANSKIMDKVLKNLKGYGIKGNNIKMTGYNLSQDYKQDDKNRRIAAGYVLTHRLNVKVKDIKKTSAVIDSMHAAGANQFNGVDFTVSSQEKIERELLTEATKNGREKARIVAAAGNRKLGNLLRARIGSDGGRVDNSIRDSGMFKTFAAAELSPSTQVSAGTVTISVTVETTFELK